MSVVGSRRDADALTLTIEAEFDAAIEQVWKVWRDPRKLERWWGPPGWPATFERHDFEVGGESHYFMSGPDGERSRGWWRITALEAPRLIEFDDGFSDGEGKPSDSMPTMKIAVTLTEESGSTRMTTVTSFKTREQFEQVLEMGMEEGMTAAMGQIDSLL